MGTLREETSKRIREYRKVKGHTLEEFAHLANLSTGHLNKIELGYLNFTIDSLEKILNALKATPSDFFQFDNDIEKSPDPLVEKTVSFMKDLSVEDKNYVYQAAKFLYHKRDSME